MKKALSMASVITLVVILFAACTKTKGDEILVYPNPATNYIIFDASSNAGKHKNGEITVKDLTGMVVKVFRTDDSSRIQWQIDTFQRGIYQYYYKADKMKTQTGKIQFN